MLITRRTQSKCTIVPSGVSLSIILNNNDGGFFEAFAKAVAFIDTYYRTKFYIKQKGLILNLTGARVIVYRGTFSRVFIWTILRNNQFVVNNTNSIDKFSFFNDWVNLFVKGIEPQFRRTSVCVQLNLSRSFNSISLQERAMETNFTLI